MTRWRAARTVVGLLFAAPCAAQQLRGTVVDSTSRLPIPGVVVTAIDSAGNILARNLTDARGTYFLTPGQTAARVRAVRIGFRPREVMVSAPADGESLVNLSMLALPTMLEPAHVDAKQCPRRSDSQRALGLWEQARAGLLASVVASEANPARMVRLGYERTLNSTAQGAGIARQIVTVDSADRTRNSYIAARRATDFVTLGFSEDIEGTRWYYAPDAQTLLEAGFGNGYCMRLAPRNRVRVNQAGLVFAPADRRRARVDITGTLWIDTVARALRDIEYRYVGTIPDFDAYRPGGTLSFREMPNGVVLIDRWDIRSIAARGIDVGPVRAVPIGTFASTSGGEVAHARWPDGSRFDTRLSSVLISATTRAGTPATGAHVKLADTPYGEVLGPDAEFAVGDLLPGPYVLERADPRLASIAFDIPTGVRFTAVRDSVHLLTAPIPTLEEWMIDRCVALRQYVPGDTTYVLARVVGDRGEPIADAGYVAEVERFGGTAMAEWAPFGRSGRTGPDGLIPICTSLLEPLQRLKLTVSRRGGPEVAVVTPIAEPVTVIPLRLPARRR